MDEMSRYVGWGGGETEVNYHKEFLIKNKI